MEMKWATFIDRNWVGCGWEGDRCRVLVPLCHILFTCLIDLITKSSGNSDAHTVLSHLWSRTQLGRTASDIHMPSDMLEVCGGFDAVVSFCWVFLFHCSVRLGLYLGHWWKGMGTKRVFSYLKALSVSLGFQSVLSAECKMAVWNLLCRLYWIGSGRSLFFSRCLAQGRGISTIRTLLAMYFLFKWKKSIDVDLIGPSVIKGLFQALCLSRFSLIPQDFEVRH